MMRRRSGLGDAWMYWDGPGVCGGVSPDSLAQSGRRLPTLVGQAVEFGSLFRSLGRQVSIAVRQMSAAGFRGVIRAIPAVSFSTSVPGIVAAGGAAADSGTTMSNLQRAIRPYPRWRCRQATGKTCGSAFGRSRLRILGVCAAIGASALLGGCATSSQTYAPDGRQAYSINCSGVARTWGACYEKAGNMCAAAGYDVVEQAGDQYAATGGGQYGYFGASSNTRSLVVACKRPNLVTTDE